MAKGWAYRPDGVAGIAAHTAALAQQTVRLRQRVTGGAGGLLTIPGALANAPAVPDGQAVWDNTAGAIGINDGGSWRKFVALDELIKGPVTSGLAWSPNSGWDVSLYRMQIIGGLVSAIFRVAYSGTTVTVPAGGNITDMTIARIPGGFRPDGWGSDAIQITGNCYGESAWFGYLKTAGQIAIASGIPGATLSSGKTIDFNLVYPLALA